mgnify:CR=1 FL=1
MIFVNNVPEMMDSPPAPVYPNSNYYAAKMATSVISQVGALAGRPHTESKTCKCFIFWMCITPQAHLLALEHLKPYMHAPLVHSPTHTGPGPVAAGQRQRRRRVEPGKHGGKLLQGMHGTEELQQGKEVGTRVQ